MRKGHVWLVAGLVLGMLLAACAPGAPAQDAMMEEKAAEPTLEEMATPDMMAEKSVEAMPGETMGMDSTPEMMDDEPVEATVNPMTPVIPMTDAEQAQSEMMAPAWYATPFTDAVSGESFKIADFQGKVVLVETFAQWCSTCLRQQQEVLKLHEMLGMPPDLVTVGLDVDPNEDAVMLKAYLEKHGFNWHYAIASPDTIRAISDLYGVQFLNPPSAPMLIIDRHGEAHPLPFGVKSADDLKEALQPFLADGM
jgi:cytochrome oxidase Cu insertion factor (SCO1/SenC/PrrC family)